MARLVQSFGAKWLSKPSLLYDHVGHERDWIWLKLWGWKFMSQSVRLDVLEKVSKKKFGEPKSDNNFKFWSLVSRHDH